MLEGVVPGNTPPLKVIINFIDDGKPVRQKVYFLDIKWDLWLFGQSRMSPHLTNNVRNKERNE